MKTLNETLKWGRYLTLIGAVSLMASSCNLLPDDDPEPSTDPSSNPATPTVTSGDGALVAIKSITYQDVPVLGQVQVELGLAVASFFNNGNTSSFVNAGTVTCEDQDLTRQDNNSYVYTPSASNTTGIEFVELPNWSVSGAGSIAAFNHTTSLNFPVLGAITSSETISSGSDYTLTVANVSLADSVIFMIGDVVHIEAGNVTSSTFTSAELGQVGNGTTYAQVAPYNYEVENINGKTYWFINERVVTQTVTIE